MTTPWLALERVSHVLPDGRTLFSELDHVFDHRPTGLVGRNGVGKSVLARLLAGELNPSQGRCMRSGRVQLLRQHPGPLAPGDEPRVAGLAGLQPALDALARIEAGSADPADFAAVDERWDLAQRLRAALQRHGLGHLSPEQPARSLSGGEAWRVALVGAWLSEADFLILDEPSNHLDRESRQALIGQLRDWPRGLLVISHDRQVLDCLEHTVELSSLGLRRYGGNHAFYAASQAHAQEAARTQLARRRLERRRTSEALREQLERQARRQARGQRQQQQANQARILLDRQQQRSEASAGRLQRHQAQAREQLDLRVREAAQALAREAPVSLRARPAAPGSQRQRLVFEAVTLPGVRAATRHIDLVLEGPLRLGLVGPNGCGKSSLLKLLAGRLAPVEGRCLAPANSLYLDQQLADLAPQHSALAWLQEALGGPGDSAELRTWLAQLGLDARRIAQPLATLSGGERMKAALARALYAQPAPALLLLDEPDNHLDLPSLQALEAGLRAWRGGLVVVSHDEAFLQGLGLHQRLRGGAQGWRLEAA